jgi:hypothetical protein
MTLRLFLFLFPLAFCACLLPRQTHYRIDFRNRTIQVEYRGFFYDSTTHYAFPDSLRLEAYPFSERDMYGAAHDMVSYLQLPDSEYLRERFRDTGSVQYRLRDKKFYRENGVFSIAVTVQMVYGQATPEIKKAVLSGLVDGLVFRDRRVFLPLARRRGADSLAANGALLMIDNKPWYSWDLADSLFIIDGFLTPRAPDDRFMTLINPDGTLRKEKMPAIFVNYFASRSKRPLFPGADP